MTFGLLHVALGLTFLAAGPALGGPGYLMAWPGLAAIVVGAGYLGVGPRVFGKRAADGRTSPLHGVLLLPYVAAAWAVWQLRSRTLGEPPHDEVAPGILVGRRPLGAHEVPAEVRVVVDLTSELPRAAPFAAVARYRCVPTLDTAAPAPDELRRLIDELAPEPGPVLLHCAMGHGRSATVAAALLIRRGLARDVDDAVARMTEKRRRVFLHPAQRAAVERLGAGARLVA